MYYNYGLTYLKNNSFQVRKVSLNIILIYYTSSIEKASFTAFFRLRDVLWLLQLANTGIRTFKR
jgi:hypothetical protein